VDAGRQCAGPDAGECVLAEGMCGARAHAASWVCNEALLCTLYSKPVKPRCIVMRQCAGPNTCWQGLH
jgi:hypothetical protein